MVKLIGLVEPIDEASKEAFEEWYLGNHIEDVSHTPGIIRATAHRLVHPFMKTSPPKYITIYEFETDAAAEAHLDSAQFQKNVAEFTAAWPESERVVIRAVQVYP